MSRNGKRKSTTKIIIFMVELIVVALLGVACYVVVRAFGTDPEKEGVTVVKLQEEKLEIAEEVKENETMKGYMNVERRRTTAVPPYPCCPRTTFVRAAS